MLTWERWLLGFKVTHWFGRRVAPCPGECDSGLRVSFCQLCGNGGGGSSGPPPRWLARSVGQALVLSLFFSLGKAAAVETGRSPSGALTHCSRSETSIAPAFAFL
uniref:Secreted protein n=1 Tax=Knipowitschia caucasica TaxID=637954 RepID=A0AAV2JB44_KNICA